jgi:hypothetical protein
MAISDFRGYHLFCFGDIEGANITSVFKGRNNEVDFIGKVLQLNKDHNLNIKLQTLNTTTKILLTGDIVDNEKYDIRLLKAITGNNDLFACTIGNRDLNKLRLGLECFIVKKSNQNEVILPWQGWKGEDFESNCLAIAENFNTNKTDTYKFLIDKDINFLKTRLSKRGTIQVWNNLDDVFVNDLNRINNIYKDTLGAANTPVFRANELVEILQIQTLPTKMDTNAIYVATAISNMVMAFEWPDNLLKGLPAKFIALNGLYVKYLRNADIIKIFKYAYGKFGVMSHAGLPPALSSPMGYGPKSNGNSSSSLVDIIVGINKDKNDFLTNFNIPDSINAEFLANHKQMWLDNLQYIDLCANIGDIGTYAGSKYSPIVSHSTNQINTHPLIKLVNNSRYLNSSIYMGGAWPNNDIKPISWTPSPPPPPPQLISLNIFGHQPQGLFPTVIRTGQTMHVCLDVSMLNRKSLIETGNYACMYIGPSGANSILGKLVINRNTVLAQGHPNTQDLNIMYKVDVDIIAREPIDISNEIYNTNFPFVSDKPIKLYNKLTLGDTTYHFILDKNFKPFLHIKSNKVTPV